MKKMAVQVLESWDHYQGFSQAGAYPASFFILKKY